MQKLFDAIMSTWSRNSNECFKHVEESTLARIEAVLRAKGGQIQYKYGVPNKVLAECICLYSLGGTVCLFYSLNCEEIIKGTEYLLWLGQVIQRLH